LDKRNSVSEKFLMGRSIALPFAIASSSLLKLLTTLPDIPDNFPQIDEAIF
jgi:hypothetical protein